LAPVWVVVFASEARFLAVFVMIGLRVGVLAREMGGEQR
jgi:hypothetical protein